MKKFLLFLFIFLTINSYSYSENLPSKLFGIIINDDASKYVDLKEGKISENRPGIISYYESDKMKINNLIKNSDFDKYYIRTDNNNKIKIISGYKLLENQDEKNFQNECVILKNKYIKTLSNFYEIDERKFKNNFYKSKLNSKNNRLWYWDSSEVNYTKQFNSYNFQILCIYTNYKSRVFSRLHISLMDQTYFKNMIFNLFEKTEKFDNEILKSNLKGF